MDPYGYHATSCGADGLRNLKHTAVRDINQGFCNLAGLDTINEQFGLVSNRFERPADTRCRNWSFGKDAWMDVTVINPFSQDYIMRISRPLVVL